MNNCDEPVRSGRNAAYYTRCQQRMPRWGGLAGSNSTINFTQATEFDGPTFNDVHQGGGMRSL